MSLRDLVTSNRHTKAIAQASAAEKAARTLGRHQEFFFMKSELIGPAPRPVEAVGWFSE
jgi:hypothetical protein